MRICRAPGPASHNGLSNSDRCWGRQPNALAVLLFRGARTAKARRMRGSSFFGCEQFCTVGPYAPWKNSGQVGPVHRPGPGASVELPSSGNCARRAETPSRRAHPFPRQRHGQGRRLSETRRSARQAHAARPCRRRRWAGRTKLRPTWPTTRRALFSHFDDGT
jgi:hypothetical protein